MKTAARLSRRPPHGRLRRTGQRRTGHHLWKPRRLSDKFRKSLHGLVYPASHPAMPILEQQMASRLTPSVPLLN